MDVTVIRDYLGHACLDTTSRYITTNLQIKRVTLEMFWRRAGLSPTRVNPWKPTPDLRAYLTLCRMSVAPVFILTSSMRKKLYCRLIGSFDQINPLAGYCAKQPACVRINVRAAAS